MSQPVRNFSYTFAHGAVRCTLTFEGERAESLPEMLDNINAVVSKQVCRFLVPKIDAGAEGLATTPGQTAIRETVKVELLGHTITLNIDLDLEIESAFPEEALRALVVNIVATPVFKDAIGRFSACIHNDSMRDYIEQNPQESLARLFGDDASDPLGLPGSLAGLLGAVRRGGGSVGILSGDPFFSGFGGDPLGGPGI